MKIRQIREQDQLLRICLLLGDTVNIVECEYRQLGDLSGSHS
jgi:hypothetical protein